MNYEISAEGSKEKVLGMIERDVHATPALKGALAQLIKAAPGTHISIEGNMLAGIGTEYGNFEFRGSCWTPKT